MVAKEPDCMFKELKEGKRLGVIGVLGVGMGEHVLGGVSRKPCWQAVQVMPRVVKANPLQ